MFSNPTHNIEQLVLNTGMKVADFGAGSGAYTLAAANVVGDEGTVYAIEIQKELVSNLKRTAEHEGHANVQVMWADLEAPQGSTLSDMSIDAVIVANILFQVADKEGFLKEAYRVLHPKGKVLIVDWVDSFGGLGPQPEHVYTEANARALAEKVGFTVESGIQAGEHHYGFIARK